MLVCAGAGSGSSDMSATGNDCALLCLGATPCTVTTLGQMTPTQEKSLLHDDGRIRLLQPNSVTAGPTTARSSVAIAAPLAHACSDEAVSACKKRSPSASGVFSISRLCADMCLLLLRLCHSLWVFYPQLDQHAETMVHQTKAPAHPSKLQEAGDQFRFRERY